MLLLLSEDLFNDEELLLLILSEEIVTLLLFTNSLLFLCSISEILFGFLVFWLFTILRRLKRLKEKFKTGSSKKYYLLKQKQSKFLHIEEECNVL